MSSVKILIAYDQILGFSENKKVIKDFIKKNDIKDYRIEKVSKIPEEIEDELSPKELYYDHYYDCVVSEDLLYYASSIVGAYSENLLELERSMLEILEYVKMDPHECDMILEMHHHVHMICSDTIGIDDCSPEGYYSDYYDISLLIKRYLEELK